ncbi:hypothetical protein HPB50_002825 [Hyalomma asiaticum]|uniref:Uncharacterized protein n=1 Tax=Hyalomma asiaticum TaxID=266040 RepID=A0ACB7SR50_HYAAI|nr:hypothetical protein HPB50_002825 [Hyalomma asiaticum]
MSQSAAAAVATSEPASSTAVQPPGANSSASTMKPATHADAAASGSAFPVKAAEGAPSFPSCAPAVPTSSTTASLEGGSSEQTDSTAPRGNKSNTLPPESSCSTIAPSGTLTPKLPLYDLLAAIISTARLSPKDSEEVTLQAKPAQSLVFLRTHSPLTANACSLSRISSFRPPPSSSSSIRESASTSAPSPPGSYAAVVKAPSALSHSSSSNTPQLSLTNENRSFDLLLAMLERNQREQESVSSGLQQQIHSLTQTLQATTSCLTPNYRIK